MVDTLKVNRSVSYVKDYGTYKKSNIIQDINDEIVFSTYNVGTIEIIPGVIHLVPFVASNYISIESNNEFEVKVGSIDNSPIKTKMFSYKGDSVVIYLSAIEDVTYTADVNYIASNIVE